MNINDHFIAIGKQTALLKQLFEEGQKKLNDERSTLEKEKKLFEETSQKINKVHFSNVVTLNIGGIHFTTSLSTLQSDKDSFFAKMFSGNWKLEALPDGSYFIDRDGTNFRYLLNYLRTGKIAFPEDEFLLNELLEEATYYNIQGFVKELTQDRTNNFSGSTLLTPNYAKKLNEWVGYQKWQLIYKASRDGFQASTFHQKCNGQGPTITVVRSSNDCLFGGYTPLSWSSSEGYKGDSTTFLFTLKNPHNIPPTRYSNTVSSTSIYDYSPYGPTFGGGHDLHICDQSNSQNSSYTGFPHSFADTTGKGNATFTGAYHFTLNEIEVFKRM